MEPHRRVVDKYSIFQRGIVYFMLDWFIRAEMWETLATFFISMVPVIELRGGLPYGIAIGLEYPVALISAILGNMMPVPFIILFIRRTFAWLRELSPICESVISRIERKAHLKGRTVQKYSTIGLCILVAIPLPGTGAWTGALVAALLDIRLRRALPSIFAGICIAAMIMSAATFGVIQIM